MIFNGRPTVDMSFEESYQKLGFPDEVLAAGRVMDKAIAEKYEPVARMESFSDFINRFVKVIIVSAQSAVMHLFLCSNAL